MYFNYKIQITFVKLTKYKIQNTWNVFQLLVFQLLYNTAQINDKKLTDTNADDIQVHVHETANKTARLAYRTTS